MSKLLWPGLLKGLKDEYDRKGPGNKTPEYDSKTTGNKTPKGGEK